MAESVRIRLLGTSFTIQTDQNPDYVESLIDYLEKKIEQIGRSAGSIDSLKTSILVSLLVVDELFQARMRTSGGADRKAGDQTVGASADDRIDEIARGLIDRIDSVLDGQDR